MKFRLSGLALLLSSLAAVAQSQPVITPPPEGVAITPGGWYVAGTTFANGMAYPPGVAPPVQAPTAAQAQPPVASYPTQPEIVYQTYSPSYGGGVYAGTAYYGGGYYRYPSYGYGGLSVGIDIGSYYGGYGGFGGYYGGGFYRGYGGYSGGHGYGSGHHR